MTGVGDGWRIRADVAWIGDEARVIAARTSPPDIDGPRILEGAASWVWLGLATHGAPVTVDVDEQALVDQALKALAAADLIEPA